MKILYNEKKVKDVHEFACHLDRIGCEDACICVVVNHEPFDKLMKFLKEENVRDYRK